MESIAIISDIHGNLPALEAVLDHIKQRGIKRIICLGDLVGKGPLPAQTVERIREVCEITVQGNWDHGIHTPQEKEAGVWQQRQLSLEQLDYLGNLPFSVDFYLSGRRVRLFHASAQSVYHRVYRKAPKVERMAMFENTKLTGSFLDTSLEPDVIGYGDIHVPYSQTLKSKARSGLLLFNTGAVGAPYDGCPDASYVILEGISGSEAPAPFGLQFVRVPYDTGRAIEIAEQVGLPNLQRYRYEISSGLEQ